MLESFLQNHVAKGGAELPTVVIPPANPDSLGRNSRYNSRGVDINRNFDFNWHIESVEPRDAAGYLEAAASGAHKMLLAGCAHRHPATTEDA